MIESEADELKIVKLIRGKDLEAGPAFCIVDGGDGPTVSIDQLFYNSLCACQSNCVNGFSVIAEAGF